MYTITMKTKTVSGGAVHAMPDDLRKVVLSLPAVYEAWQDITPLARNEWICWVLSAQKIETRQRRIRILSENLAAGKRRPCCWAGCPHREK